MSQETLTHEDQSLNPDSDEVRALLEQVRRSAVQLLTEVGRTPRTLRVRAGNIVVEIEWGEDTGGVTTGVVAAPAEHAPAVPEIGVEYLTAPTVGVFYRAPEPGADPFVVEGDLVAPGRQIGIIEAMKLMIPVEADRAGRITGILKANGEPVEYGERLFTLSTEDE
jgi:acetyl-CoA carboxylase biotin carboxyl carrier protein